MKKFFSRTIIPFFIIAILFGGFGVGRVEAVDNTGDVEITITDQNGSVTTSNTTADPNNFMTTDSNGNTLRRIITNNTDGTKTTLDTYNNGNITRTTETKDADGKITTTSVAQTVITNSDGVKSIPYTTTTIIKPDGVKSIEYLDSKANTYKTTVYDANGKIVSETNEKYIGGGGSGREITSTVTYDSAGNAKTTIFNADGSINRTTETITDKNGKVISSKTNEPLGFWGMLKKGAEGLAKGTAKVVLDVIGFSFQILIIPMLGILVRICGYILDTSVVFTLDSANLGVNGSGIGVAILTVWVLVRNIFNITFIFILLWSAIQMILGIGSAGAKKMIANVIIAALLINFSLFITRVVIDIGNILGTELYNLIKVGYGDYGIGTIMMDKMGLSELWNFKEVANGNMFTISVLQIIMLLTTIITFMYASLLMIARTVSLIFIMVMSPLGFMGDVIPAISEYTKMWRTNLFGQVSTAPLFLLFIYLIVKVSESLQSSISMIVDKTNTNGAGEVDNPADYISYLKYVMIIMLLIIAVKVVKKQSGIIGGAVEKFGAAAAGIALGAATGGAALLATKTLGAGASAIRDSKWGEKLKDSNSFAARMTLKGLDKTSKSTFDARNTSAFKSATGFVGDQTGIKVDYNRGITTKKDGFEGAIDRRAKKEEEYAKMITKDMPEITSAQMREERTTGIDSRIADRRAKIAAFDSKAILTEEDIVENEKYRKEIEDLEKRKTFDDVKLKKEMEKEAKNARLDTQAAGAESSALNWLVGGKKGRKAMAAKVRKLKGEKSAAEQLRDLQKKQAEEDAATGINPPTPPAPTTPPPAPNPTP